MQFSKHTKFDGAPGNGRVVLVHDHDRARRAMLKAAGGRVVGWVDGRYRIEMGEQHGR